MTTTAIPAADTGLSEINRRRLLLGLAAASTAAAAAPAFAVLPAAHSVAEDRELIQLGNELPATLDVYLGAQALEDERCREGRRRWPTMPEALFRRNAKGEFQFHGHWATGEMERAFEGGAAWHKGEEHPRLVIGRLEATSDFRQARDALANKRLVRTGKLYGRTRAEWEQRAAEAKPLADIAEAYYGQCERIRADLDWDATWRHASATATALGDLITRIMAIEARTMEGVVIKGQALAAWGQVRGGRRIFHNDMSDWGPLFAADVLRLAASTAETGGRAS